MRKSKKYLVILAIMVMVLAVAACTTQTQQRNEQPTTESETETPADQVEASYTSLDDFMPYDENNQSVLTGRDATGQNGMVSTDRYEASKIGIQILEQGGNAFDAAVAVGFTLGLCNPAMIGPGGGGFMTAYKADTQETIFINFRENAPAAATPDMWVVGEDGKVVDNEKARSGKSQGVPGLVAGMLHILENYGTMDRETVIQPTIDLALEGITITPVWNGFIQDAGDIVAYPEFASLYLKDGLLYEVGDVFTNPDYAKTMEIIKDQGLDGFYKGPLTEAIVAANNKYNGIMTMEDLANYTVTELEPVSGTYRGYDIISSPAPSSGGTILIEILNILENFDLSSMEQNSAEELHIIAEALDMAYIDRNAYMGDPNYVDVPISGLINKEYAKQLADKIDINKATENENKAIPWDFENDNTNHFSIADKYGNMVSVTFSNNSRYGSGIVVEGYGFVLNNHMDDFVLGADHPNSVAGGKIPLSSMSPTIILKDGKPAFITGSPGGPRIIAIVAQVIRNLIDHDIPIQEAVNSPRIFWGGENKILYEEGVDGDILQKLMEMGHEVEEYPLYGCANSIVYLPDGTLEGAGDPRRDSKALGY